MEPGIHPDYRPVVLRDRSAGVAFLTQSTAGSITTIEWEDSGTYPVVDVDVSSANQLFWTGRTRVLDSEAPVDRFQRRYAQQLLAPSPGPCFARRAAAPGRGRDAGNHDPVGPRRGHARLGGPPLLRPRGVVRRAPSGPSRRLRMPWDWPTALHRSGLGDVESRSFVLDHPRLDSSDLDGVIASLRKRVDRVTDRLGTVDAAAWGDAAQPRRRQLPRPPRRPVRPGRGDRPLRNGPR